MHFPFCFQLQQHADPTRSFFVRGLNRTYVEGPKRDDLLKAMREMGNLAELRTVSLKMRQVGAQTPKWRVSSLANCSDWVVRREAWNFSTMRPSATNSDLGAKKQKKTCPPELISTKSPMCVGKF